MKKNRLIYATFILALQLIFACTPEDLTYYNNEEVDPHTIDSVVLMPNQLQLIADGRAQLDLHPIVFNEKGFLIPDSRVKEEWLEYTATDGTPFSRHFSTSDASLIGKDFTVQVRIKGTDVVSNTASFRVIAPLEEKYTSEITIPVVFHIIQTNSDIDSYGGAYSSEKLEVFLQKLNNLFAGSISVNPVGVDTHIRFKMAQYDPEGLLMQTPGINRLTIETMDNSVWQNKFADFLESQHLAWPGNHYLNIWLISDRESKYTNFFELSANCLPHYVYPGTPEDNRPEGIEWEEYTAGQTWLPNESGIIYKLQELDMVARRFDRSAINELSYYVGCYLGLFPTYMVDDGYHKPRTDYCDDTIDYLGEYYNADSDYNHALYKTMNGCYFRAENIMDDPVGLHTSVTKNQCERMRWVLENCPERALWKSNFAFTGK